MDFFGVFFRKKYDQGVLEENKSQYSSISLRPTSTSQSKYFLQSLFVRTSNLVIGLCQNLLGAIGFPLWLNFAHYGSKGCPFRAQRWVLKFSTYTLLRRRSINFNSNSKLAMKSHLYELSQHIETVHETNDKLNLHDFSIAGKFWHNLDRLKHSFL